jgi:hypothetical protein
MPWDVTIRRADKAPLGDMAAVRRQITASLPGICFYQEPSGADKITAARANGVEFPDVLRQHLEGRPAVERAEFAGDEFSILLYGFESQPLLMIHAEVRGNGKPLTAIAALCLPNGWIAVDDANGQPVELGGESAAGWESFRKLRDEVLRREAA